MSHEPQMDPEVSAFFDGIIEKITQHPMYSKNISGAVEAKRPLVLNYHTHGPAHGYCVSVCALPKGLPVLGQKPLLEELAHIKGIASQAEECDFLMKAFGLRLQAYYELPKLPKVFLNGAAKGT